MPDGHILRPAPTSNFNILKLKLQFCFFVFRLTTLSVSQTMYLHSVEGMYENELERVLKEMVQA
jgi:hypothetical protein